MEEFRSGQHVNQDPDQEIHTWKNREAALARDEEEEENDEDEMTPMAKSPKQVELKESSKQAEPKVGTDEMVMDVGQKEPIDPVVIQEEITKDQTCIYFLFVYI